MRSYAEREVFTELQLRTYGDARALVARLPHDFGTLRCHEIARGVAEQLKLRVIDGHYGMVEHSWLLVPPTSDKSIAETHPAMCAILDAYTPGQMPMVQLVDPWQLLPESRLYIAGAQRDDIDIGMIGWLSKQWDRPDTPLCGWIP